MGRVWPYVVNILPHRGGLVDGDGMVSWMVETIDTLSSSMAILQWLEH